jgi:hypothetical protein
VTASLLTEASQLNPSPRFRRLIRQFASNRDTEQKTAPSSRRFTPDRPLAFGFQWYPSSEIGRWLVAGALVAAGRLVAGKLGRREVQDVPQPVPCAYTGHQGERCPNPSTHVVTWPTYAVWSDLYCEMHVNEVRRVPGVTVTCLDGEEE